MGNVDELGLFRKMRLIEDPLELCAFVGDCLKERGAQNLIYLRYVGLGPEDYGSKGILVRALDVPEDWLRTYISTKAFAHDPLAHYARMTGRPFYWTEVDANMRMTSEQKDCLDAQRAAGLVHGVGMHVLGPELRDAYVGFGLDAQADGFSEADLMEWQSIIQMAHLRCCALRSQLADRGLDLAPREREILQWIARGKSNAVIARILDISPHTIDTLVRRMFDKLEVSDRTSAAIKGVGLGQILLN